MTTNMKTHFEKQSIFVVFAIIGFSSSYAQDSSTKKEPGINTSYMDKNIRLNDDFFRFVNGSWLNKTEIPADKTTWGSFNELRQKTDNDALEILAEASKNPKYKSDTDQGKALNLYKTMRSMTIMMNGMNPTNKVLGRSSSVGRSKINDVFT